MGFWSSSGREADGGHGSKNNHDLKSNLPARCCRCDRQPCICQGSGTTSIPRKPVNTVTSSHSEHHSYRSTEQKGRTSSGRDLTSTRQQQRSVEDLATSLVPRSKAHHSSSRHDQAAQGVRIRQQRRKGSDRREAQPSSQTSDSPEPYVQPLPNLWQSFLPYMPQSIDDQSIVMSFKRIIGPAGQYVNNFYEDRPGLLGDIQPFLEPLGFSCREAYSDLTMSLETLQHPTTAIKHSLVVMLLSVIHPDNLSRLPSILPDEFLAMTKATRQSSTPDNEDIPGKYLPALPSKVANHCRILQSLLCVQSSRLLSSTEHTPGQGLSRPKRSIDRRDCGRLRSCLPAMAKSKLRSKPEMCCAGWSTSKYSPTWHHFI